MVKKKKKRSAPVLSKPSKSVLAIGILCLCTAGTILRDPQVSLSPTIAAAYLKNATSEIARKSGFDLSTDDTSVVAAQDSSSYVDEVSNRQPALPSTFQSQQTVPPAASAVQQATEKDPSLIDDLLLSSNVHPEDSQSIREYVEWHQEQRRKFPDTDLLTNPDAPRILISYFDDRSEGLAGRFFALNKLFWAAQSHNRVVLLVFYRTFPLETFLSPSPFLNWTLPLLPNVTHTPKALRKSYGTIKPEMPNHTEQVVVMKKISIDKRIARRERDAPFGVFWELFFQPSPMLQKTLDETYQELNLTPGNYDAIHCRVLHPAHRASNGNVVDKKGLTATNKWETHKRKAIRTGIHAIQCSDWLARHYPTKNTTEKITAVASPQNEENLSLPPTYFFSDAQELVQAVLNMTSETTTINHSNISHSRIVGRYHAPVSHLESKDPPVEAVLSTFVDLYMASNARCITLGVGKFSYLAARISGTKCIVQHEGAKKGFLAQKWGYTMVLKNVPQCPLPRLEQL